MSSAFISYSRKDQAVADFIAAELRNRDVDVFVDYQNLRTGNFMSQLGQEIERRKYFIVVVSPDSVLSDWVEAEVTSAFVNKKIIIPIWYKLTKLTKVFVLEGMEGVNFERWETDGMMDEAIQKLTRLMSIPREPIKSEPVPEPMLSKNDVHKQEKDDAEFADENDGPSFTREDVQRMFNVAASVQDTNPEQALFLYQQVLEYEPDYLRGKIRDFVARQQENMKPKRLEILEKRIESAKRQGRWAEARQLADTMIEIDPHNEFALDQIQILEENVECEPVYEQAKIAAETGNRATVNVLMRDIQDTCPYYGDPAGLLAGQPIIRDLLGFLHNSHTFVGHTGPITKVTFSNNGSMLATASTDHSVRIWSSSTGEMLCNLTEYTDSVKSISFSPDDKCLVSVSETGRINLWSVDGWELIQTVKGEASLYDVVFATDSKTLITGTNNGLQIHDVPQITSFSTIEIRKGRVTSLDLLNNGMLFVSSVIQNHFLSWINIWNTPSWDKVNNITTFESQINGHINKIRISYEGKYLASVGSRAKAWERPVNVWEMPQGWDYWSYYAVNDLTFSPSDPSLIIFAGWDRLTYFDLNTKQQISSQTAHKGAINSIAMSRDGRLIATGSGDCLAKIWQL